MLIGPIGMNRELDHLDDCTLGPSCCNPAHVEPVTRRVNEQRKAARVRVRHGSEVRTVRACGPRFNKVAATNPAVIEFATRLGLPRPH